MYIFYRMYLFYINIFMIDLYCINIVFIQYILYHNQATFENFYMAHPNSLCKYDIRLDRK